MKTAEEVMQEHLDPHDCLRVSKCYDMTLDAMIEFAKMHVEAALKEASEKAKVQMGENYSASNIELHPNSLVYRVTIKCDKDSILTSYPTENIK